MRHLLKFLLVMGLILTMAACQNNEPALEADAGADFTIQMGESPTFDGCASAGDIVNYQWTIVTPSDNMPEDAGKVIRETDPNCSFTLDAEMGVDEVGTWVIELQVRDAAGNAATDTVSVEVTP